MRAADVTLPLTLEELHGGCTKRRQPTPNGPVHKVVIRPGHRPGDKVRLGGTAYVVAQREHARFARLGDDLHTHLQVPLGEALSGFAARVVAIDGEEITVASVNILRPGDTSRIPCKGLSRAGGAGRGDLVVHFDVVFPTALLPDEKQEIRDVLARAQSRVSRAPSMFNLRGRALSEEALDHGPGDEFRSIGSWGFTLGRRFSRESDSRRRSSRDSGAQRRNAARNSRCPEGPRKLSAASASLHFAKSKRAVQKLFNRRASVGGQRHR